MKIVGFFVALFLVACAQAPAPTPTPSPAPLSAQAVVDRFVGAGLVLSDIKPGSRAEGSPLPNSYTEHVKFVIDEIAPEGGQVFLCSEKRNCDALVAYFDALKALAGPYLYQSPDGLVVAQLNSGLTPETAKRFEEVIQAID